MSLKTASRETRLQWFARAVVEATWMGSDVCGGDIQQWALQAGLIVPDTVTEQNRHEISNGEYFDIGDTFYRFSPDLEDVDWNEIKPDEEEGVNYRQLKQAASETSYAATGSLNVPRPVPGQKPKAL